LELHHRLPFPIVDFDQPADAYLHMVAAAITSLGVTPGRHAMNFRFFEPSLRHRSSSAGNAVAATLGINRSDHWAAALSLYRQLLERT
jgi:hypothetical protein